MRDLSLRWSLRKVMMLLSNLLMLVEWRDDLKMRGIIIL